MFFVSRVFFTGFTYFYKFSELIIAVKVSNSYGSRSYDFRSYDLPPFAMIKILVFIQVNLFRM